MFSIARRQKRQHLVSALQAMLQSLAEIENASKIWRATIVLKGQGLWQPVELMEIFEVWKALKVLPIVTHESSIHAPCYVVEDVSHTSVSLHGFINVSPLLHMI